MRVVMKRTAAVVALVVALGLAGEAAWGASRASSTRASAIQLLVRVTAYKGNSNPTKTFTLGCQPVSGSLPFAQRVCRDIASHPQAMLAPVPARAVCVGSPFMSQVEVKVTRGPKGLTFSPFAGNPNCNWPGGTPIAIYYAASVKDTHTLNRLEPLLRCDDDPTLLAKPTPWASVAACTHGLWTPASERDIRKAEGAPQLALLRPSTLFPRDIGAIHCRIPAGGPNPRTLDGVCGVRLTGPPSAKLVHFVETWSLGGPAHRHTWTVSGSRLVGQRGAVAPQFWR
jgi:hypothetical protein